MSSYIETYLPIFWVSFVCCKLFPAEIESDSKANEREPPSQKGCQSNVVVSQSTQKCAADAR